MSMKIRISDKVVFWQEYNPVELSMLLHEKSGEINPQLFAKLFDNPCSFYIKDKEYPVLSLSKACRAKSKADGAYHLIYIQVNYSTNEYYIGKVNRERWSVVGRYQGSGVRFKAKYAVHSDEFARYYIASCESNEETELLEAEIVDDELLQDPLCLNLVRGGGGVSRVACAEEKKEKHRKYMLEHPEQSSAMLQKARELYASGNNTEALAARSAAIKETMSDDFYRNQMRERIQNWRESNPEDYREALEKSRAACQIPESREKRRASRYKWIEEHSAKHEEYQRKLREAQQTEVARKKRSKSLKEYARLYPEQAQTNLMKRVEASSAANRKRVNMCDLSTGDVIKTFTSQREAAAWLVEQGIAKNMNCVSSISQVCLKKPCTTGYGYRKKAYGFGWEFAEKEEC